MCRFILFKGADPVFLADLLTRPAHSIINQAFDCRLRVDFSRPLNGDGFGVGCTPCIFTSILPAWSNLNLERIASKIQSNLIFAHVRSASAGFAVSENNCHPFQFDRLMFMHNGYISNFNKIKRRLQGLLKDEMFHFVQGSTDSEWAFALFLNCLEDPHKKQYHYSELMNAILMTIEIINSLCFEAGVDTHSLLNFAVSDGHTVVCTRYCNDKRQSPASLFYSCGTSFESTTDQYKMIKEDNRTKVAIVASEPLTFERSDWNSVSVNTMVVITNTISVQMHKIPDNKFQDSMKFYDSEVTG